MQISREVLLPSLFSKIVWFHLQSIAEQRLIRFKGSVSRSITKGSSCRRVGIHKKEDSIIVIRKKGKQIKSVASKAVLQNCLYRHIKKGDSTSTFLKILQETMVVRIRRKAGNAISAGKLKHYHQKDLLLFKNLIPLIYLKSKQLEIINKQLRAWQSETLTSRLIFLYQANWGLRIS